MFRTNLKTLREERGMSQAALAKELSIAQATVAGWESGRTEPSIDMLKKLCAYFLVTMDSLLGDGPIEHVPPARYYTSKDANRLRKQYDELFKDADQTSDISFEQLIGPKDEEPEDNPVEPSINVKDLKDAAELYKNGYLTKEEFEIVKKKIMGI